MNKIMRLKTRSSNESNSSHHSNRGEAIHKSQCLVCIADYQRGISGYPGLIDEIKQLYMRFTSAAEISEMLGEHPVVTKVTETIGKGKKKSTRVIDHVEMQRNIPERSIRRHAVFFGWDSERANDIGRILDSFIDIGINQIQFKGLIDERTLVHAIDMRNKMSGAYYKPGRNPRDVRTQMRATVEEIYRQHRQLKQYDVSHIDIIEHLSHRPGFTHIKTILKDEQWGED